MTAIRKIALGTVVGVLVLPLGLHLWFVAMLSGPPPEYAVSSDHTAYYFAYGSNMSPQYLGHIRGVEVPWSAAATLEDYRVEFGLPGIGRLEPAFANLRPAPGGSAMGVVHQLSEEGIRMIAGSEGEAYGWKTVTVMTSDGQHLAAQTLVAVPDNPATEKPSRRYLQIMHDAARLHGFPERELEKLDPSQGVYVPVFSELMGVLIQSATWLAARS